MLCSKQPSAKQRNALVVRTKVGLLTYSAKNAPKSSNNCRCECIIDHGTEEERVVEEDAHEKGDGKRNAEG